MDKEHLTEITFEDIFGNVVKTEYYDLRSPKEKQKDNK